jgi:DNA recombination protein RmuC
MEIIAIIIGVVTGIAGYFIASSRQAQPVARLEEQLKAILNDNNRLKEDIQTAKKNAAEYEKKIASLSDLFNGAEQQRKVAEAELASTREQLSHKTSDLSAAQKKVEQLNDELTEALKLSKSLEASEKALKENLVQLRADFENKNQDINNLTDKYQAVLTEHTELKTSLDAKEQHYLEQLDLIDRNKQALTKEFENLANKVLEEKGKNFASASQSSLEILLKPFREQIEGFQKRINDVHDASIKGNTDLAAEIKKVLEIGNTMSAEANNLTKALKGDSQQRGAWGEAQLERTLEMSGLVKDVHYETQSAHKDADGKRKQTDYLIRLPDDKSIIIDSKVSLNAYDRAVSAETPEESNALMLEHVRAVRRHIDDLASKDYTNVIGMNSPQFVLMFMPIEPAYIDALKSQKDLFEYGYKKNIVLVSHTTLIPILRTVANLWMIEQSNKEAREIADRAGEIFNTVVIVSERLKKLGNTLKTATNHYNDTVTSMVGQQGLVGKVQRFEQLSTKANKNMPQLEYNTSETEGDRLDMVVQSLPDDVTDEEMSHTDPES